MCKLPYVFVLSGGVPILPAPNERLDSFTKPCNKTTKYHQQSMTLHVTQESTNTADKAQ